MDSISVSRKTLRACLDILPYWEGVEHVYLNLNFRKISYRYTRDFKNTGRKKSKMPNIYELIILSENLLEFILDWVLFIRKNKNKNKNIYTHIRRMQRSRKGCCQLN